MTYSRTLDDWQKKKKKKKVSFMIASFTKCAELLHDVSDYIVVSEVRRNQIVTSSALG